MQFYSVRASASTADGPSSAHESADLAAGQEVDRCQD